MGLMEDLTEMGVNVNEALERFMGNASLYERMLGTLPKMIEGSPVSPDFDSNDYADVIEKTHALKGTTGNLSITPLYEAYTEIVNLLRSDKPEEAREILVKILPVQEEIVNCIKKYAK